MRAKRVATYRIAATGAPFVRIPPGASIGMNSSCHLNSLTLNEDPGSPFRRRDLTVRRSRSASRESSSPRSHPTNHHSLGHVIRHAAVLGPVIRKIHEHPFRGHLFGCLGYREASRRVGTPPRRSGIRRTVTCRAAINSQFSRAAAG